MHTTSAVNLYKKLASVGICREQARMVLPQNLYTEYYGTVNLNNLIKFVDLRADEHAQWEIRKVADACIEIAKHAWPEAINAYYRIKKQRGEK